MPKVNYYIDTWKYFSYLNKQPLRGTVLDYGSNYGMFLDSSKKFFPQENYTGVDIDLDAITEGQCLFPNARFIHYNRYNVMYNKSGDRNAWPAIEDQFDNIISYSVLTHTTVDDTLEAIEWLYKRLKPGKKMLLTWLDVNNEQAVSYFQNKRIKDFGSCDTIQTSDFVYLVNNKTTKIPGEGVFLVFYQSSYFSSLLKNYNHQLILSPKSVNNCFQDCVIITKE